MVLEAKEKSRELPGRAGAGTGEESPTEYAGNKIEAAEYRIGSEAGSAAYRGGKKIAKKSREVIRERREERRAAQSVRKSTAETASGFPQTGQGKTAGNVSRKRDAAQVRIKEKQKGKAGVKEVSKRDIKKTPRVVKSSPLAALMAGGGRFLSYGF